MLLGTLTAVFAGIIVVILVVVGIMWLGKPWFIQWLKGTAGILMLFGGVIIVYSILDLITYKQAALEPPALTVTTYRTGDQTYDVSLVDQEGTEQRFVLRGDQWQLDARMLRWTGPIASLNAYPLYRWDRLSGRYLSLEQQRSEEHSAYSLAEKSQVDLWSAFAKIGFWLKAEMGSAVFMPMANGATFAVFVTNDGVVTEPVNAVAEKALKGEW
ncbi:hypothetical protein [Oceanobacter mangrovi]|uniref:hypothetical protein n=1 Tax=Oceanobacter mangrovi TaxID=2862510 RepID=UPI001C8DE79D|nr:hypothetical protein [Oceanobacter mangrovi]